MPEVSIDVAGRSYRLGCGEGEEAHVQSLAARIDTEASALAGQLGHVTEGRLLLMTALMLADKLAEAEGALVSAKRDAAEARQLASEPAQSSDMIDPERDAKIAANLDALAERIEVLAGRVEAPA